MQTGTLASSGDSSGGFGARVELFEQSTTRFDVTHHHKISWISYSVVNISDMAVEARGGCHFIMATRETLKTKIPADVVEMLNNTGCIKTSLLSAFSTNSRLSRPLHAQCLNLVSQPRWLVILSVFFYSASYPSSVQTLYPFLTN